MTIEIDPWGGIVVRWRTELCMLLGKQHECVLKVLTRGPWLSIKSSHAHPPVRTKYEQLFWGAPET